MARRLPHSQPHAASRSVDLDVRPVERPPVVDHLRDDRRSAAGSRCPSRTRPARRSPRRTSRPTIADDAADPARHAASRGLGLGARDAGAATAVAVISALGGSTHAEQDLAELVAQLVEVRVAHHLRRARAAAGRSATVAMIRPGRGLITATVSARNTASDDRVGDEQRGGRPARSRCAAARG